ncbi:50S ribosomal protein L18 [Candidatus Pacearchaeota archaeon]|nr:50S ribosomal protein L18 [Candidatus Pacearchaeota archaeon]
MKTQKRRRKERKTDYKNRFNILKSELPRVVFRKTNRYIIGQLVESRDAQDKIIVSVNSKDLLKFGWVWAGSLKSVPVSYLAGILLAKKIKDKSFNTAILDIGLIRDVKKSRIYAFVKGVQDGGISLRVNEKYYPSEERIIGMHMKKDVKGKMEEIIKKIEHGRQRE